MCENVTTVEIRLQFIPSLTDQIATPHFNMFSQLYLGQIITKQLFDILHEGDTMYLLNIETIIYKEVKIYICDFVFNEGSLI